MHKANIRFFDSESAAVWNELSVERALSLVPVEDIRPDQLTSELIGLQRAYTSDPPYVFLHVSVAEARMDEVVVWAIRRNCRWALVHAVSSVPVADTITEIALSLPVKAVFFVWEPQWLSLVKHYLLRCIGRRSAVPLDVMWLLRRESDHSRSPRVLIRARP